MVNETTGERARLLRRYRTLCEALGIARASGATLPPSTLDDLQRVEACLIDFLNHAAEPVPGPPAASREWTPSGASPPSTAQPTGSDASSSDGSSATIFTDGSAEGNPGPGGYCAILRIPGRPDRELSGGTVYTTNNKMELTAAIAGLEAAIAAGAASITVVTDSEYVKKGATQWLRGWERNGWKTASGQPVKNRELWEKIAELIRGRAVHWQWVKGHVGHPENERADLVATTRAREAARAR
jgi:ribonuclease HI